MMDESEREDIKSMITMVTQRLKASSIGSNQVGARYARLLELLWNKSTTRSSATPQGNTPQPLQQHQGSNQSLNNRALMNIPHNSSQTALQAQQQDLMALNDSNTLSPMANFQPALTYDSTVANFDHNFVMPPNNIGNTPQMNTNSTFSWLDLNATWEYANNALAQNYNPMDGTSGMINQGFGGVGSGLDGMDLGVVGDFRNMKSGDYGLIF